jgi:hypothetical protein
LPPVLIRYSPAVIAAPLLQAEERGLRRFRPSSPVE